MKISEAEHLIFASALQMEAEDHGIYPTGAGQHARFRSLLSKGLIHFEDMGFPVDRVLDHEVKIFRLTPRGRRMAAALEDDLAEDRDNWKRSAEWDSEQRDLVNQKLDAAEEQERNLREALKALVLACDHNVGDYSKALAEARALLKEE